MKVFSLESKTVNDLWYMLLWHILETEDDGIFKYAYPTGIIQKGSFEGEQTRLQFPGVALMVEYPNIDYIVTLPEGSTIPAPTSMEKVQKYFEEYLIGYELKENETYTYGNRINISIWGVIEMLKKTPVTNQAVIEVARPEDWDSCKGKDGQDDPPCLRLIDFKVVPVYKKDNGVIDRELSRLNMSLYFRSWDLYAGLPENLGGLSLLQQFVSDEIGIPVGAMYAYSSGLHLYKYQKELAEMRTRMVCPAY